MTRTGSLWPGRTNSGASTDEGTQASSDEGTQAGADDEAPARTAEAEKASVREVGTQESGKRETDQRDTNRREGRGQSLMGRFPLHHDRLPGLPSRRPVDGAERPCPYCEPMIRHTVSFTLVHAADSPEEQEFLTRAPELLRAIDGSATSPSPARSAPRTASGSSSR